MIKNPLNAQLGQQLSNAQSGLDFSGLNKLKQQARENDPAALKAVAEQFEALFLNMLMKNMRSANNLIGGEDNPFNSSDVQFYQGMLDQELSLNLAGGQGIGLADVLIRQLSRSQPGPAQPIFESNQVPGSQAVEKAPPVELKPGESAEQARAEALRRHFDQALDRTAAVAAQALLQKEGFNIVATGLDSERGPAFSSTPLAETIKDRVRSAIGSSLGHVSPAVVADAQASTVAGSDDTQSSAMASSDQATKAPVRFDTPEVFVDFLYPIADQLAHELGVDPKVLVSQAALETGWGKHLIRRADGQSSYNLFNIKADQRWSGERAVVGTLEYRDGIAHREQAAFRVYDSYEESLRDYIDFLKGSPRYQQALEQARDPHAYVKELQKAGYATDPAYAEKISTIIDSPALAAALDQLKRT